MKIFLPIFILFVLLSSCKQTAEPSASSFLEKSFAPTAVPAEIRLPGERNVYFATHYWDALNLNDTTFLADRKLFEENFIGYLHALSCLQPYEAERCVKDFMRGLNKYPRWRTAFLKTAEQLLYDAASPMLNEELYIPFAQSALFSPGITEARFVRYNHQLEVARKNRPGTVASDFKFIDAKGRRGSLHALDGDYLLLFFYDPECENCNAVRAFLQGNELLQKLVIQNRITVLMVYAEGDKTVWERCKNNHPQGWLSVFDSDESIMDKRIYELRAMPGIYLLDSSKRVVLKDVMPDVLMRYLNNL